MKKIIIVIAFLSVEFSFTSGFEMHTKEELLTDNFGKFILEIKNEFSKQRLLIFESKSNHQLAMFRCFKGQFSCYYVGLVIRRGDHAFYFEPKKTFLN